VQSIAATAVSAHRRDHHGDLEGAVDSGAEYVEIDVRRVGDGRLVVHHGLTVGRLPLARCTYERICAAAARPVPLLHEALDAIAGRALGHLDLKERGCEHETVELALDRLGPGRFVVTSRDPESIRVIKRDFPEVVTALSVGRAPWERGAVRDLSPLSTVRRCGADMVALNHRLARIGVLAACARAGFPAMVWTVNAESLMRRFLADPRVAVLVTDHPRRALALRDAGAGNRPAHPSPALPGVFAGSSAARPAARCGRGGRDARAAADGPQARQRAGPVRPAPPSTEGSVGPEPDPRGRIA